MSNWIQKTVAGAALATGLAAAMPAHAADIFIRIDGIKGESVDAKHKGEIDVLSWSWGAAQSSVSTARASGAATGKASTNALLITKVIDVSSPVLIQTILQGKRIPSVVLTVRRSGGRDSGDFIKIQLKDVLVSSIVLGSSAGNTQPTEEVYFQFASAQYSYSPQKADGTLGAAVSVSTDATKK
jgi:type VI secretion system secreted protein Hcp